VPLTEGSKAKYLTEVDKLPTNSLASHFALERCKAALSW
jgi:hypothetical protein